MPVLREITVSFAALFATPVGMFRTTGTAGGDCDWNVIPPEKAD